MANLKEVMTRLGAARTRLILEKPFIGALVMHLPLTAADPAWCETVATDARAFHFNPDYIAQLTLAETQFVLAHEAMHCALGHFARRSHRTRRRWDVASDYAVNQLLVDEGLKAPAGALLNPDFRGLSAEEIYPHIPPDTEEATLDRHVFDESAAKEPPPAAGAGRGQPDEHEARNGTGAADHADDWADARGDAWDDAGDERRTRRSAAKPPVEPGPVEREALMREWQGRMASSAQQARRAGRLGQSWLRLIDALIQPQLPWRVLLARFMISAARDDYSYQRPSRRDGPAVLPRLASGEVNLLVALDTSGSVSSEELAQFVAEVDALKGQIRARVTLQACDEALDPAGPWTFQAWEPIALPQRVHGSGGTSFVPVFDWVAREQLRPDLLLYFTDAEGEFPPAPPDFPVIWLVKGRARVPWGERIQLN